MFYKRSIPPALSPSIPSFKGLPLPSLLGSWSGYSSLCFSYQLQAWIWDQAWPIMKPHCPLSTIGPRDGHWANASRCMRFVTGFQTKKIRTLTWIQSHLPRYTENKLRKEANPEEKGVRWTEDVHWAVHALCLRFHVCKPMNAFSAYITLSRVSVTCYRILPST